MVSKAAFRLNLVFITMTYCIDINLGVATGSCGNIIVLGVLCSFCSGSGVFGYCDLAGSLTV
jgi:hypothetical protein